MVLTCSRCATTYSAESVRWRCDCGGYLRMHGCGMFSTDALASRPYTMWRYREAFGIDTSTPAVSLGEGWTPLQPGKLGGREFLFKLDYLCSTGSYKDRGASVMLTQLKHWGLNQIIEDSSGNAGAAIAAYSAKAGIACDIFVPASTSAGKAAQISIYGGNLRRVPGSREQTTEAAVASATGDVFYASHNWSPFFLAGMKSIAFEISEQMTGSAATSSWQAPDWVVLPVGGGSLITGVFHGFRDLRDAGIIRRVPKLLAVQAATCAPVERAWAAGLNHVPAIEKRPTVAEGISIAQPVRGEDVLEAIRNSKGRAVTVDDEHIWATFGQLAKGGLYVEPTSAAAAAAAQQATENGLFAPDDRVVIVLTGIGLKATDKIVEHFSAGVSAEALHSAKAAVR